MTTATSTTPVLRKYRVRYAVTRPEWYEIEATDANQAREAAFSDGTLVLIGAKTEAVDCEDVEIAAFSAPVSDGSAYSNVLTPPKE